MKGENKPNKQNYRMQTKACSRNGIHGLYSFHMEESKPNEMFEKDCKDVTFELSLFAGVFQEISNGKSDSSISIGFVTNINQKNRKSKEAA